MDVNINYPHKVITELFSCTEDMTNRTKWCIETFGSTRNGLWYESLVECILISQGEVMPEYKKSPINTQCFFFKNKEDAIMFKLTWGGYYNYANNSI